MGMPRQPRLVLPDTALHIVHRGNNRSACFQDDGDFLVYRALLLEGSKKSRCAIHAYCLMGNHIHLLLTPASPNECAAFMHGVAQRYAHYYNRTHRRTGTLWEGRFRSCVVATAEYVLACYRYIELNPVRAGLVGEPGAYRWSSYRANCGTQEDPLVTPHAEFAALARCDYLQFVAEGIGSHALAEIRQATNHGYPLTSESVKAAIGMATGRKVRPGRPGRPAKDKETGKSVAVPDFFSAGGVS